MKTIAEVIEIPESVHAGDFVLRLSEGVSRPERTLEDYVVTPALVECFEQAMSLIKGAVVECSSKGAFLHGSFGSGKSHFMAVLKLLLDGHVAARSKTELAEVVSGSNAWASGRKFLVVPYHMIGATGMESAIFGQYARFVRDLHPGAPTPGFYRADEIFADARRLREKLGDEKFFAQLGTSDAQDDAEDADDGWGSVASDAWDAASFEAATTAAPESEDRIRLVGDLIDTYFQAARGAANSDNESFVPLDEGLAVMANHAKSLGYDGLVLFLDELILWLASHAADTKFLGRESQKIAKLVEASVLRPIPIVSFIARQRDLRELVGDHMVGAEQANLSQVLSHWSQRFAEITLEDRNLPLIAQRRLLKPKSAAAKEEIDNAFAKTKVRDEVMNTLLTREGDRAMFRQVYPFSPALVQTLIAVSSLLQRERTALRLMQQLLVDQRDTLALGDVVPVGDLYDLVSVDDLTFSKAMRNRFEDARKLYEEKLLPTLEGEQGVTRDDIDAGRVTDERKLRNFRNDDRLIKTLLLSALADGVESLRALTPARLAALNHGSVNTPVPGDEGRKVLTKLRGWSGEVGEIRISEDSVNPTISLQIVGVDTAGILENAQGLDNFGNRVQKVREIIYQALELDENDADLHSQSFSMLWRGTRRNCELVYANVRSLSNEQLRPGGDDWRIVIDYPFDMEGHGRRDDTATIQRFQNDAESSNTLVWLPAFLTLGAQKDLGTLVLLDQVLSGNRLNEYGSYLSQGDRDQARGLLVNRRDTLRQRVILHLLAAYDIIRSDTRAIDVSSGIDDRFTSLNRAFRPETPVGAHFKDTLEHLLGQALAHQYKEHPDFPAEVRKPGLRRALEAIREAVQVHDGRVEINKPHREEVRNIVVPLRLGTLRETHFVLGNDWKEELLKKQRLEGVDVPTVGQLRRWIDADGRRGLPTAVENLVINAFALQTGRSFMLHGGPVDGQSDRLPNEITLHEQALPSEEVWTRAVKRAGKLFGYSASPLRNAQSVALLAAELKARATSSAVRADEFRSLLSRRLEVAAIEFDASDRYRTAEASVELLSALERSEPDVVVDKLVNANIATSSSAMSEVIKGADALHGALSRAEWSLFANIARLSDPHADEAKVIVASVHDALRHDEHVTALAETLADTQKAAIELLSNAATRAPSAPPPAAQKHCDHGVAATSDSSNSVAEPATVDTTEASPALREGHRRVPVADLEDALAAVRADLEAGGAYIELRWTVHDDA